MCYGVNLKGQKNKVTPVEECPNVNSQRYKYLTLCLHSKQIKKSITLFEECYTMSQSGIVTVCLLKSWQE